MKVKKEKLTKEEAVLLDEYTFYIFISKLYNADNPVKSQQLMEGLCEVAGCNKMLINTAVSDILSGAREYKPRKAVYILLLSRVMSVRDVCRYLHISMTTYYKMLREVENIYGIPQSQFDETTYTEVKKFLDYMGNLMPIRGCDDGI